MAVGVWTCCNVVAAVGNVVGNVDVGADVGSRDGSDVTGGIDGAPDGADGELGLGEHGTWQHTPSHRPVNTPQQYPPRRTALQVESPSKGSLLPAHDAIGEAVGLSVGAGIVGVAVGVTVGEMEGTTVGADVTGPFVGSVVGWCVGANENVGECVRNTRVSITD